MRKLLMTVRSLEERIDREQFRVGDDHIDHALTDARKEDMMKVTVDGDLVEDVLHIQSVDDWIDAFSKNA